MSERGKVVQRRKKLRFFGAAPVSHPIRGSAGAYYHTAIVFPKCERKSQRVFFDDFADVFTSPEDIVLHECQPGDDARLEDARRIRQDVDKAAETLGFLQRTA